MLRYCGVRKEQKVLMNKRKLLYFKSLNKPPGNLFIFWIFAWGTYSKVDLFEGVQKLFLLGHIPVEIFLLVNYFFDVTHTCNRILLKERQIFVNKLLLFLS